MKVAVLGNSHIASLKSAWDMGSVRPAGTSLTFFGRRGDGLLGLDAVDGRLVPRAQEVEAAIRLTSGGLASVDPSAFDAFILYGLYAPAYCHFEGRYSRRVTIDSLVDMTSGTASFILLERLRTITAKPIFVGHDPLIAARDAFSITDTGPYAAGLALLGEHVYAPRKAVIVGQPLQTIVNGCETHPKYNAGAPRFNLGDLPKGEIHAKSDRRHMNAQFGELWLKAFFAAGA